MHYKGTNKKLPEIARELNVDAVVEGSALLADGRVRITAQLIQADDDQNLWADSYDRELKDVLSIQQDIARAIANEMKSRILVLRNNRMSQSLVTNIRPVNPEAQDEYFKGSYHRNKGSVEESGRNKRSNRTFRSCGRKGPQLLCSLCRTGPGVQQ